MGPKEPHSQQYAPPVEVEVEVEMFMVLPAHCITPREQLLDKALKFQYQMYCLFTDWSLSDGECDCEAAGNSGLSTHLGSGFFLLGFDSNAVDISSHHQTRFPGLMAKS